MLTDEILNDFDIFMRDNCQHAYKYFEAPLPEDEIRKYMDVLGIEDEDFLKLYSWKNGIPVEKQDYAIDTRILMQGNFMNLKDIVQTDKDNTSEGYWVRSSLKPIIANYEGEYLLIETDKTSDRYKGIFFYSPNFSYSVEPISYFDNIGSMLKSIVRLFESGVQWYDNKEEMFDYDPEAMQGICKELNPESDYWRI